MFSTPKSLVGKLSIFRKYDFGLIKVPSAVINLNFIALKCCSTLPALNLPRNLQLADLKVLEEPSAPLMPPIQYDFPILDVPKTLKVTKFNPHAAYSLTDPHPESVDLERKIFEVAIRRDIVNDAVRYTRNKRRQPKKTKTMSEIRGSNKKPRPQKGGGQSQVGHKRNSAYRGGMKAHGPVIRDYSIHINRKTRALAMMMTFAAKLREGNLIVFDKLECETHRSKDFMQLLGHHKLNGSKILFVDEELNENFEKASRNISNIEAKKRTHMHVYNMLQKDKLAISLNSFKVVQQLLLERYTYNARRKHSQKQIQLLEEAEVFANAD
eukprot:gene9659-13003_t